MNEDRETDEGPLLTMVTTGRFCLLDKRQPYQRYASPADARECPAADGCSRLLGRSILACRAALAHHQYAESRALVDSVLIAHSKLILPCDPFQERLVSAGESVLW